MQSYTGNAVQRPTSWCIFLPLRPSAPSAAAAPPSVAAPADNTMDVDLRGDNDDFPMEELGCIEDHCIHWYHQSVWNEFA